MRKVDAEAEVRHPCALHDSHHLHDDHHHHHHQVRLRAQPPPFLTRQVRLQAEEAAAGSSDDVRAFAPLSSHLFPSHSEDLSVSHLCAWQVRALLRGCLPAGTYKLGDAEAERLQLWAPY